MYIFFHKLVNKRKTHDANNSFPFSPPQDSFTCSLHSIDVLFVYSYQYMQMSDFAVLSWLPIYLFRGLKNCTYLHERTEEKGIRVFADKRGSASQVLRRVMYMYTKWILFIYL